jgi:hypothetical protein
MTRDAILLPDRWTELERRFRFVYGNLRLDEYSEALRVEGGVHTEVRVGGLRECAEAWQGRFAADKPVTLVDSRSEPHAAPRRTVVLTSAPLATRRYGIDPPLDDNCRPFEAEVTITTAGSLDVAATLADEPPERGSLVALFIEEGLSVTLLPHRLVLGQASPLPLPADQLPSADELERAALPHFDGLDDRVVAAALASVETISRSVPLLRGRMATYLAHDMGRGLAYREARGGGETPSFLSLALAELAKQGAVPHVHRPLSLVGEYVAARSRWRETGTTEHRCLAASGTFVGDGALGDCTRWQAAHGTDQLWLFRPDGSREVVYRGSRSHDRRVVFAFEWRVGRWIERWTRTA